MLNVKPISWLADPNIYRWKVIRSRLAASNTFRRQINTFVDRHMLDLRRLTYFVVTADELHFGRAADKLNISQPPLTRQIAALEKDLGIKLFERTSRVVKLTPEGEMFLHSAKQVVMQAKLAEKTARRAQLGDTGRLSIGFSSSITLSDAFIGIIKSYTRASPSVSLEFSELSSTLQIEALLNGALDVGFIRRIRVGIPTEVEAIELNLESFMVVLHTDHELAGNAFIEIRQLELDAFVLFPPQSGSGLYEQVLKICGDANFIPTVRTVVSQITTIVALVAAGQGVSIVPASSAKIMRKDICYVPLSHIERQAEMAFICRRHERLPAIMDFVKIAVSLGSIRQAGF